MRGLIGVRVENDWKRGALSRMAAIAGMLVSLVLVPRIAVGQVQATIAGSVKDGSGAVLPGVTVEVASPVLIEKTRTAVTDGTGQFESSIFARAPIPSRLRCRVSRRSCARASS